jgi:alpha-L-fucosidase 2
MPKQTLSLKTLKAADWKSFLSRHDLIWSALPSEWESGAFIGNGLLGAMIYSQDENEVQWDIGRSDVTERLQTNSPTYGKHRLPIGRLVLKTAGRIIESSVRLDLWNAETVGTIQTDCGQIEWKSFVHADQHAIVVECRATEGEADYVWRFIPERPINPRQVKRKEPITDNNPPHVSENINGVEIVVQKLAAGGEFATAWKESIDSGSGNRILYLSVGSSYPELGGREEALEAVLKAEETGFSGLLHSHQSWWHSYYPASFLSIPDTRLESLYWIQMYKLASATRAERPLLDLMGPWFYIQTPWPAIWWNLNVQLTYWPVYASNRLHLGESLTRFLEQNLDNLIQNVPESFRHDSAAIGRSSSYDGIRPVNEEVGNLPWICHNYWLHYRHSMDESMLRDKVYPLLRRSINYYLHLLKLGSDGKLHLPLAISPEYPDRAEDCNYDLSLLRWGCQTLLYICERLHLEDPLLSKWEEIRNQLTEFPVDETGFMIGKDVPLQISHRHYSHLFMIYPLYLMSWEQPEHRDLILKSLNHWIGFTGALQGYSYTGASSIYSSMGWADEAVQCLNDFMKKYLKPNTMYMESGPVIETPLSAAASIHDLLLQSWGNKIRIFPAVPKLWENVSFHDLRAEGGFLISAAKLDGATRFIVIRSEAGEPCRIQTDIKGPITVSGSREFTIRHLEDGCMELDLQRNEFVVIYPEGSEPDLSIMPVSANESALNTFGSPKS